jgi:hypothetical protein
LGSFGHQKINAMKKLFSIVIVATLWILAQQHAFGFSTLKVVQLINYPDTAVFNQQYPNIFIKVVNFGPNNFYGDIHVLCRSASVGITDTLRDDPFQTNILIFAGDTATIQANPQYAFRPNHFAAGDNIIVVWPFAGMTVDFDTSHVLVFLTNPVGIEAPEKASMAVFPDPVSRTLTIHYSDKNAIERVRIYDLFGREVFSVDEAVSTIDLTGIKAGIYIVEMSDRNGNRIIKKILVTVE